MSRPRGRPRAERGVYSFESPTLLVPDDITIDTSFATEALQRQSQMLPGIRGFLDRLADANSLLVFSRLLELELREAAFRLPLQERYRRDWKRRRHDGRSLRRARRLVRQTMESWEELLSVYDHEVVELEVVSDRFGEFMDRYGLGSYDAVHAATAERTSSRAIATTDAGFANVPASRLVLYVDSTRVGVCRRWRAG